MLTLKRTARRRHPKLLGQTVVVLGGSAGIGLEIAGRASAAGADVVLTDGDPVRLERAALEVGAGRIAAFDAGDQLALKRFFDGLPGPIDHVAVTVDDAAGEPSALAIAVAGNAAGKMRPGGTLLLVGGTGSAVTAALSAALAPVRIRVARIDPALAEADDVVARAVRAIAQAPLGGATYDIDGDRQLLARAV